MIRNSEQNFFLLSLVVILYSDLYNLLTYYLSRSCISHYILGRFLTLCLRYLSQLQLFINIMMGHFVNLNFVFSFAIYRYKFLSFSFISDLFINYTACNFIFHFRSTTTDFQMKKCFPCSFTFSYVNIKVEAKNNRNLLYKSFLLVTPFSMLLSNVMYFLLSKLHLLATVDFWNEFIVKVVPKNLITSFFRAM